MATIRLEIQDGPGVSAHSFSNFRIYISSSSLKLLKIEPNTVGWLQYGDERVPVHILTRFSDISVESDGISAPVGYVSQSFMRLISNGHLEPAKIVEAQLHWTPKSALELPIVERITLQERASSCTDSTFYTSFVSGL